MLPPVRTISGSSGSYQSSSSVSASAHLTGEAIYPGHAADADRDVNPNHSGKLNILLLNGRDGVPEGLGMIADALGRAVNLPRREGETPSAYVTRLALALSVMPAVLKADAEHELMKILRGVRLQLVIEAFLNPAGPEAARIVALLEMAGTTERDLAALTVLTSYRQNDGGDTALPDPVMQGPPPAPRMPFGPPPAPEAPVPGAPLLTTAAAMGAAERAETSPLPEPAPSDALPPAEAADPDALERQAALPFTGEADDDLGLIRYRKTDNIFSRTSAPEAMADRLPDAPAEATPVRRAMADLDPARLEARTAENPLRGLPAPTDARGLQTVLTAAFAAGDSEDPLVQAKAAMDLLAGEAPDAPAPAGRLPAARRDFASRPFADYARPAPRPLPRPEDLPPIFGLKGWPEDIFIEPGILPASRLTEAVLAATLVPHAGPEPDQADPAYVLRGRGVAANDIGDHGKAALEAAEQQLIRTADQAAGLSADRRLDPLPRSERSGADQLLAAALQLGIDPRQGMGFASLPNPIADERDEGAAPRRGHRASGEGEGDAAGDEQSADRGFAEDGPAPEAEDAAPEALASEDAQPASGPADAADPAYDYYQRMAGWS